MQSHADVGRDTVVAGFIEQGAVRASDRLRLVRGDGIDGPVVVCRSIEFVDRCSVSVRPSVRVWLSRSLRSTAPTIDRMSSTPAPAAARQATPADVDAITAAFTTAFFNDPVWARSEEHTSELQSP